MAGVRSHFAPAVSGLQPVNHRGLDRLAKPLGQGRADRGGHHQIAGGGALQPRFQKSGFLLLGEQGLPASALVAGAGWRCRLLLAICGLDPEPVPERLADDVETGCELIRVLLLPPARPF